MAIANRTRGESAREFMGVRPPSLPPPELSIKPRHRRQRAINSQNTVYGRAMKVTKPNVSKHKKPALTKVKPVSAGIAQEPPRKEKVSKKRKKKPLFSG